MERILLKRRAFKWNGMTLGNTIGCIESASFFGLQIIHVSVYINMMLKFSCFQKVKRMSMNWEGFLKNGEDLIERRASKWNGGALWNTTWHIHFHRILMFWGFLLPFFNDGWCSCWIGSQIYVSRAHDYYWIVLIMILIHIYLTCTHKLLTIFYFNSKNI